MNEIEIPFGNRTERGAGLAVQLGFTALGVLLMFLAYGDGHLAAMFVGPLVALGGLIGGGVWRRKSRPRRLVVEPQGLRWAEKNGSWAVPWYELAAVALSYDDKPKPSLWLHLTPHEPRTFLATYRSVPMTAFGHRIQLPDDIGGEMLDLALQRHARQVYRGFVPHFDGGPGAFR
ncbi:hypothetical protein FHX81_5540 [Saccharothrix saharensis]|uniref:Uncharacterized protein n=1 Tax=Saccharothrix saharensis TaxID=571190 RepID=A0A543JK20_9PSEU|nr:hypothetical protein [Saccharothrix saharensis]TQM83124.1 hypothetical protein FHX81_5540 [Saccharothrix saharensis]